ncbi:MAG: DUF1559 domain-containing protein, partial [Akkermansiaceae bacterium]|nr:DUF1559 domain-containing protein [Armatimonadota bacterium]
LFPVFAQARDKARQTSCLSNIKQLGLAMVQYTIDYDETYPRADYFGPACPIPGAPGTATGSNCNRINHFHWWVWLYPYTKNTDILFCPSRPLGDQNQSEQDLWTLSSQVRNGYLLNLSLGGATNQFTSSGGIYTGPGQFRESWAGGTEGGVRSTADTLLFMEGRNYFIPTADVDPTVGPTTTVTSYPMASKNYWYQIFYGVPMGTANTAMPGFDLSPYKVDRIGVPHSGGLNIAYADGHAKWMNHKTFLNNCPEKNNEYPMKLTFGGGNSFANPAYDKGALSKDYPMWNLYKN